MPMTTETVVPVRGVQIDCRAQRLTMPALLDVLKDLSHMGYNTILLEYYDRFPYRGRVRPAVADGQQFRLTCPDVRDEKYLASSPKLDPSVMRRIQNLFLLHQRYRLFVP